MGQSKNLLSDWNYKDPTRLCALIQEMRLGFIALQIVLDVCCISILLMEMKLQYLVSFFVDQG